MSLDEARVRVYHKLNALDFRRKTHHFVHIPKNGGRSIREALTLRRVALPLPLHSRYCDLETERSLRYFCTVRNPWSRTASRYLYMKVNARDWAADDPRAEYIRNVSFDDYVREQRVFPLPHKPAVPWPLSLWINQLDWMTDRGGNVACDRLRLETIDDDLSAYFGRRIQVPHARLMMGRYDYRTMYSAETIKIIAETYARDVDYFGFDFESPASRATYTLA